MSSYIYRMTSIISIGCGILYYVHMSLLVITVALPYSHLPYSHISPTVTIDCSLDQTPIKKPPYSHIWLIVTITKIFIQDYNKTPSIQSQVTCVDFNSAR